MASKRKTYQPSEAAAKTGYHVQWIYRLCQQGKIGVRVEIPGTSEHRYQISEKEIRTLKANKKTGMLKTSEVG